MPLDAILILTVFISIFGIAILGFAAILGNRRKKDGVKEDTYECGIPVQQKRDTKISVKFYLTAILFIIFDIEILFLFPWAVVFKDYVSAGAGAYVFYSMLFFLVIFIFGLIWEIKSRALDWE